MKLALILLGIALVGCTTCGCRGGLFGGRQSPDAGKGDIYVYRIQNEPGSRSVTNIGNAGTQSPMYQAPEGVIEGGGGDGAGTYVTTPAMPANGAQNAGTAAGKYILQTINDGVKRAAETDTSAAAQLIAGNTQSQGTMTPATVQRQGEATTTSTATQTPTQTKTTTIAPATALTGAGDASVPGASAIAAGPTSAPVVTTANPVAAPAAVAPVATGTAQYETVTTVIRNPDGTYSVTTDAGNAYTGTVIAVPVNGGTMAQITRANGQKAYLMATGANAELLCPGCSEP